MERSTSRATAEIAFPLTALEKQILPPVGRQDDIIPKRQDDIIPK